jgi:hypothetical protein
MTDLMVANPPVLVTRRDITRCLRALEQDCTGFTIEMWHRLNFQSIHAIQDVLPPLIYDALGEFGELSHALDVLDDAGLLATRLRAACVVGSADVFAFGRQWWLDGHELRERDDLPVFRGTGPRWSRSSSYHAWFRTGDGCRIVEDETASIRKWPASISSDRQIWHGRVHDDDTAIRGKWRIDGARSSHPVEVQYDD